MLAPSRWRPAATAIHSTHAAICSPMRATALAPLARQDPVHLDTASACVKRVFSTCNSCESRDFKMDSR